MENIFERTQLLLGENNLKILNSKKIIVFGIGGVGGYAIENLVRSNIGQIDIVDNDIINASNINRQIIALNSTIGKKKVDIMKNRILDINNSCKVDTYDLFFKKDNEHLIDFKKYDFIIDAIDTITSKICIIENAKKYNIPIISSMGAGNRLDPNKILINDISKTNMCPLAKVMRNICKKNSLTNFDVIYSEEPAIKTNSTTIGSISYMPAIFGLKISHYVIKKLLNI